MNKSKFFNHELNRLFVVEKANEYLGTEKIINKSKPIVSVCVATYQHENYIGQCLDGILKQKTSFEYEVIIGEDESDDNTRFICLEYANKYPNKIRLFLRNRKTSQCFLNNEFLGRFNGIWNRMSARGKYIAICEGDDYWTDPLKLQKQVNYLQKNNDCSLVFTNYSNQYDNNKLISNKEISDYSFSGIFKANPIRTVSCCFRKSYLDELMCTLSQSHAFIDLSIFLFMACKGKIGLINEDTCVYRYHYSSVTHSREIESKLNFIKVKFEIRNYFLENFSADSNLKNFTITKRLIEGYKSTLIYDLERRYIDTERNNIRKYKGSDIPFKLRLLSKNVWLEKICQYLFSCYFSLKKLG